MKVHVNSELCVGFGICLGIAPEVFELHTDGYAIVQVSEVKLEDEDAMRRAASQCPAQAISLSEDSSHGAGLPLRPADHADVLHLVLPQKPGSS